MITDETIAALRAKERELWLNSKEKKASSDRATATWIEARDAYEKALDERRIELEVQKRLLERGVKEAA